MMEPVPSQKPDWPAIRREYEVTTLGLRALAIKVGVPYSTIAKHSMKGHWKQRARQVRQAAGRLELLTNESVERQVREELAPWIEEQKLKFTRSSFNTAKKGMERIEQMFKAHKSPEPKAESFIAKSAETWNRIGRIALGMNDGSPTGGSINVNVLSNQAAIQVTQEE